VPRRATREQRQILIVAGATLVGAILFAIGAMVATSDGDDAVGPVSDADYTPFGPLDVSTVEGSIRHDGPQLYPDLLGGTRAFALDLEAGELVALHLLVPGSTPDDPCFVRLDEGRRSYLDCEGDPIEPAALDRFRIVYDDGVEHLAVDLREILPAPRPGR
jgi:hypothetical protein